MDVLSTLDDVGTWKLEVGTDICSIFVQLTWVTWLGTLHCLNNITCRPRPLSSNKRKVGTLILNACLKRSAMVNVLGRPCITRDLSSTHLSLQNQYGNKQRYVRPGKLCTIWFWTPTKETTLLSWWLIVTHPPPPRPPGRLWCKSVSINQL